MLSSFDLYQTAYLSAGIFYLVIWLAFYFLRRDLREQMLVAGLFLVGTAPINVIWHGDYWHPPYVFGNAFPFEDFFWRFAFAGVVAIAYELVFGKRLRMTEQRSVRAMGFTLLKLFLLIIAPLALLSNVFGVNSIYAISVGLVLVILYMLSERPDLLRDALWSGFFSFLFVFVFYVAWQYPYPDVFAKFWKIDAISGVKVIGIPIEELVWFFLAGAFIGPLYEFVTGAKVVSRR